MSHLYTSKHSTHITHCVSKPHAYQGSGSTTRVVGYPSESQERGEEERGHKWQG